MAQVVLGLGLSHSPILNMEPDAWIERGTHDHKHKLRDTSGALVSFDTLLARAGDSFAAEIDIGRIRVRHAANQEAVAATEAVLGAARPDVVVMFGDDHKEVFHDDNMPSLGLYLGKTIPYAPSGIMKWPYDTKLQTPLWYPQEPQEFPVAADLGTHLAESLNEDGFDIAISRYYNPGQAMSHSFGFIYWRLMHNRAAIPTVPVHLNTYFPPNQPTPARCLAIGRAIRRAIESWPADLRVAIIGTGGLSHFVVDEPFDRQFLEALASGDAERIGSLPRAKLHSGNSELRCWMAMAGAVEDKKMRLIDYIPCYRTLAGTGCGMAFASWA
jgi:3-O-methylgallate 3,4-dioxygenase